MCTILYDMARTQNNLLGAVIALFDSDQISAILLGCSDLSHNSVKMLSLPLCLRHF